MSTVTRRTAAVFFTVFAIVSLIRCSLLMGPEPTRLDKVGDAARVLVSYYGGAFHGLRTANGEIFDKHLLTAAHRTLPFGSLVRLTDLESKQTLIVRINDRGPFISGRELDLAEGAAKELGFLQEGIRYFYAEVIDPETISSSCKNSASCENSRTH